MDAYPSSIQETCLKSQEDTILMIPGFIIHLDTATERLPLIDAIQAIMRDPVSVFSAIDDSKGALSHPWEKRPVTKGEIGCAHSHLAILRNAVKADRKHIMIFEDDCEFLSTQQQVYNFIDGISDPWDILLLGANEYVESVPVNFCRKVGRFWGTHAMLLSRKAMEVAIDTFEKAQEKGIFLPADWMYNEAIKRGLRCYAPYKPDHLCRQKPGLVSAINGKIRTSIQ